MCAEAMGTVTDYAPGALKQLSELGEVEVEDPVPVS